MEQIVWIVLLVLCLGVEVLTMGLTAIWFAGGALVALILAFVGLPIWLQVFSFVLVSIILLLFTRPLAVKYFNKNRIKTNAESLVGKKAIVTAEIDNLRGNGQATVNGQEWSARSEAEDGIIPVGTVVEIVSISGVKLIVKAEKEAPVKTEASTTAEKAAE